jgi:hypothetical protein
MNIRAISLVIPSLPQRFQFCYVKIGPCPEGNAVKVLVSSRTLNNVNETQIRD